jgi:hypothetical protein
VVGGVGEAERIRSMRAVMGCVGCGVAAWEGIKYGEEKKVEKGKKKRKKKK